MHILVYQNQKKHFYSLSPGRYKDICENIILNDHFCHSFHEFALTWMPIILKSTWDQVMVCAIKQQAISAVIGDPDACHPVISRGHNELTCPRSTWIQINITPTFKSAKQASNQYYSHI